MARIGLLAACGVALLCAAPAYAANLVTNGDFESDPGDGSFVSWTITGDGVSDDMAFPNGGAHDAVFTASSFDASPGILSQDIATTPGASYRLQFALVDEAFGVTDAFNVTFGGFSAAISGLDAPFFYTPFSFNIDGSQVSGPTTTLSFQGFSDSFSGQPWNLDDVSLTAAGGVPEPAAWALMLTGFFGMGGMLRRSRALAGGSLRARR